MVSIVTAILWAMFVVGAIASPFAQESEEIHNAMEVTPRLQICFVNI